MSQYASHLSCKIELVNDNTTVAVTTDWKTAFDKTYSGYFHSLKCRISVDTIILKLSIDGHVMFNVDMDEIKDYGTGKDWTLLSYDSTDKVLNLSPNFPIQVRSSVKLEFKTSSGGGKNYYGHIMFITEN